MKFAYKPDRKKETIIVIPLNLWEIASTFVSGQVFGHFLWKLIERLCS